MKIHAFRLKQGQDLKKEIIHYVHKNNIQAGSILSCVGGLEYVKLRLSGGIIKEFDKKLEIISINGTLSQDDCHIHIGLTDTECITIGGHLKDGSKIYYTAEVVIAEFDELIFTREFDENTMFDELVVNTAIT